MHMLSILLCHPFGMYAKACYCRFQQSHLHDIRETMMMDTQAVSKNCDSAVRWKRAMWCARCMHADELLKTSCQLLLNTVMQCFAVLTPSLL